MASLVGSRKLETGKSDLMVTPKPQRQPEDITSPDDRKTAAPKKKKCFSTVLVVDDFEPFSRLVFSMLQQRAELRILGQATDGLEALRAAEELQPDLILLDIGLPKVNGIEAARSLRKVAPQTKILFLSQESSADVVRDAFRLGATGYVLKSHAGRELLPAIEAVLGGKHFVGSGLDHFESAERKDF